MEAGWKAQWPMLGLKTDLKRYRYGTAAHFELGTESRILGTGNGEFDITEIKMRMDDDERHVLFNTKEAEKMRNI